MLARVRLISVGERRLVEGLVGVERWRLRSRISKFGRGGEGRGKYVDSSKEL